ncbi:MAG: hypothetical protein ACK2UW_05625 [Anaerolineales bacterium]
MMDEHTLNKVLTEIAAEAVPEDHDPWTALQPQINRRQVRGWMNASARPNLKKAAVVLVFVTVLVAAAIALTPQGRVWAQQVLRLFTRTEGLSFPLSPAQIEGANLAQSADADGEAQPTAAPPATLLFFDQACTQADAQANSLCQAQLAAEAAGFTPWLPAWDDPGLFLTSLAYDSARGIVQAGYGYRGYPDAINSVMIFQGTGALPAGSDWQKVPAQYIQTVEVAGAPAEYVQGAFIARPGATQATWESEISMARLRWKQGEQWFEIFKAGQPERVTFMDQAGMIRLAESLAPVMEGE